MVTKAEELDDPVEPVDDVPVERSARPVAPEPVAPVELDPVAPEPVVPVEPCRPCGGRPSSARGRSTAGDRVADNVIHRGHDPADGCGEDRIIHGLLIGSNGVLVLGDLSLVLGDRRGGHSLAGGRSRHGVLLCRDGRVVLGNLCWSEAMLCWSTTHALAAVLTV